MRPSRKVGAGTLAGALTILLVWGLREFAGVEVPGEQASALTVVLTFVTSWLVPESPPDSGRGTMPR